MARLEELQPGTIVKGVLPNQQITVVAVHWRRDAAVDLFFTDSAGNPGAQLLYRIKEPDLEIVPTGLPWSFEGRFRDGVHAVDTSDLMRRMVKEDLLKFDGTRLFPERYAHTINYELSDLEKSLYDEVTAYVRKEMNRAYLIIRGQRGNRIGFALTILQRRLASSPEAIYRSIQRRRERLEERLQEMVQNRNVDLESQQELTEIPTNTEEADEFYDETPAEEVETKEDKVVARASGAGTITELRSEIQTLQRLEVLAQRVRQSDTDRKWEELSNLLQGESDADAAQELFDSQGHRRKLIIFTEHRDTLHYLTERIQTLIGDTEAIATIHGSMRWEERRKVQEAFMQDPKVQILVATDAATAPERSAPIAVSQTDRERIDRLAIAAVMDAERKLGREPKEMSHENPGYDIESRDPNTNQLLFIEVKGKSTDATTVTVSKTQIFTAFNKPDSFVLAIVEVDGDTGKEPRYIRQPFQKEPDFGVTSVNYNLSELLARSEPPG